MRFLTRSYVDWLGLPLIPIAKRRNRGIVSHSPGGCLPRPSDSGWCEGVELNGVLYEREPDGLAYARLADAYS